MGIVNSAPNNALATAYGNQRKEDRCQNGVLWSLSRVSDIQLVPAYSTDNGATWTSTTAIAAPGSGTTAYLTSSLFIDLDDYAHVVYKHPQSGYLLYTRGTPNAARTAYTWSADLTLWDGNAHEVPDIAVCRDPSNAGAWAALVVASTNGSPNVDKVAGWLLRISAAGAVTGGGTAGRFLISAALTNGNSNFSYPSVDFNHTGDSKTVAGGAPHWYVGWSSGATGSGYGIRFRKATYQTGGSWSFQTEREIDNRFFYSSSYWGVCMFDGTRIVFAGHYTGSVAALSIIDRDVADTTTTSRYYSDSNGANTTAAQQPYAGSATYDSLGNVYLFGSRGTGSNDDTFYLKWTRATSAMGTRTVIDPTTSSSAYTSTRRGPQGQSIDYVYTDGTASPYAVTSGRIALNQNPTAATPLTPADNATIDSSVDQTVTFQHNDPDGDAASAWRIRYRPAGTTVAYAYLTGSTTAANGATVTATVPANTWVGQIAWEPQTYDASNSEGAWGALRTVTGRPAALAALTGGQGGTAAGALTLYNQAQSERALRALSLV